MRPPTPVIVKQETPKSASVSESDLVVKQLSNIAADNKLEGTQLDIWWNVVNSVLTAGTEEQQKGRITRLMNKVDARIFNDDVVSHTYNLPSTTNLERMRMVANYLKSSAPVSSGRKTRSQKKRTNNTR